MLNYKIFKTEMNLRILDKKISSAQKEEDNEHGDKDSFLKNLTEQKILLGKELDRLRAKRYERFLKSVRSI